MGRWRSSTKRDYTASECQVSTWASLGELP
jgi:hypothetical protein